MFDYHIHSNVSTDAFDSPTRIAITAREKGLEEICLTDHQEIDYPYEGVTGELDYTIYDRELKKAREYVPELIIKRGVEVSLMPSTLEKNTRNIGAQQFDFVIASQHTVKGKEPYFGDNFVGKTLREAQREYLEEMLHDIRGFDDFNVIGHIGYLDKYLEKVKTLDRRDPFEYHDFADLLDAILTSAISRGKGIEVNTSNYLAHDWPTPIKSVLKRFVELGGEIISIGSDSHIADRLAYRFTDAIAYMKECGVKYVCKFTARKPEFVTLEDFLQH